MHFVHTQALAHIIDFIEHSRIEGNHLSEIIFGVYSMAFSGNDFDCGEQTSTRHH